MIENADLDGALRRLRDHLDAIGFTNLYKYIVSVNNYFSAPQAIGGDTRAAVAAVDTYLEGDVAGRRLAYALMLDEPVARAALDDEERAVAEGLVRIGLLGADADRLLPMGWQLLSARDRLLFVDAAIHFPRGRFHDVNNGGDSYLLLQYLDLGRLSRSARVLDLCTGTGLIGIAAASAAARVVSTDIADKPLFLADVNRRLNGLGDTIELRREDVATTLGRDERYDLVACNPPFVATTPGLRLPIFAEGPGRDGLDLLRQLCSRVDAILAPGGAAVFVANLAGDDRQPFFVAELDALARARNLAVEVYLDGRGSAEGHADMLARILAATNQVPLAEAHARTRDFVLGELGARQHYLTVMRLRPSSRGSLLVCNRYLALANTTR